MNTNQKKHITTSEEQLDYIHAREHFNDVGYCDFCETFWIPVRSQEIYQIRINQGYRMLLLCNKHATMIGFENPGIIQITCPNYIPDNYDKIPPKVFARCKLMEQLGGVFNDIIPVCEPCIRTRIKREYLGMKDHSWFLDWIHEKRKIPIMKQMYASIKYGEYLGSLSEEELVQFLKHPYSKETKRWKE